MPAERIRPIAIAIIRRDDQILVFESRELDSKGRIFYRPLGGSIEFGEYGHQALARELREELGLGIAVGAPITFAVHEEVGLRILLLFYGARIIDGVATANENQPVRWVAPSELPRYPMPPADGELVARLAAVPTP